jgi:hypothetical protein
MTSLGSSVLPNVTLATGLTSDAFSDLPTFRNFYAHRCRDTAMRTRDLARAYVLSLRLHPSDILLSQKASTNISIIADWVDDIYAAVDLTVD